MSVVHIENFPRSGDAASIREFFAGLAIPDGGVHILGGPNGDAFVVFSTPADAVNCMLMNGRRIHGVAVKLKSSTKEEMAAYIRSNGIQDRPDSREGGPSVQGYQDLYRDNRFSYTSPYGKQEEPSSYDYSHKSRNVTGQNSYYSQPQEPSLNTGQDFTKPSVTSFTSPTTMFSYPPSSFHSNQSSNYNDRNSLGFADTTQGPTDATRDFTDTARSFTDTTRGFTDTTRGFADTAQKSFTDSTRGFTDTTRGFTETSRGFKDTTRSFTDNTRGFTDTTRGFKGTTRGFADNAQGLMDTGRSFTNTDRNFIGTSRSLTNADRSFTDTGRSFTDTSLSFTDNVRSSTDGRRGYTDTTLDVSDTTLGFADTARGFSDTRRFTEHTDQYQKASQPSHSSYLDYKPNDNRHSSHGNRTEQEYRYGKSLATKSDNTLTDNRYRPYSSKDSRRKEEPQHTPKVRGDVAETLATIKSDVKVSPAKNKPDKWRNKPVHQAAEKGGTVDDINPFSCCVYVTNFPIYMTKADIRNKFFGECKFAAGGLKLITDASVGSKSAYMKFKSPSDTQDAVKRDKRQIDNKVIQVKPCTEAEFEAAVENYIPPTGAEKKTQVIEVKLQESRRGVIIGKRPDIKKEDTTKKEDPAICVVASNMPNDVSKRDLGLFFHSSNLIENGIKIMKDKDERGIGKAYLKFKTVSDVQNALARNGAFIDECRVVVSKCSNEEFDKAVEKPGKVLSEANSDLYLHVCNLPSDVTKRDITLFFHQSKLTSDGINIRHDSRRKGPAEAHLKFLTPLDRANALKRHGQFIEGMKVTVKQTTEKEYNQAVGVPNKPLIPSLCASVSNLPDDVKKRDLKLFFHSSEIAPDGIKLIHDEKGKLVGKAFVKYMSAKDIENALKRHGASIESRQIGVHRCSLEDFEKADEHPKSARKDHSRQQSSSSSSTRHDRREPEKRTCLYALVTNLPRDISKRDMSLFFQGADLAKNGIKILNDRHGKGLGKVYVNFASERDAKVGFSKNSNKIDNRRVSVKECSPDEFSHAVDSLKPPASSKDQDRTRQRTDSHISDDRNIKIEPDKRLLKSDPEMPPVSRPPVSTPPVSQTLIGTPVSADVDLRSTIRTDTDLRMRLSPPCCVFLTNIPEHCTYHHIQQFFSSLSIVPNGIKLCRSRDNWQLKEAYVKFSGEKDVMMALRRNGDKIGHMNLVVKMCSVDEFNQAALVSGMSAAPMSMTQGPTNTNQSPLQATLNPGNVPPMSMQMNVQGTPVSGLLPTPARTSLHPMNQNPVMINQHIPLNPSMDMMRQMPIIEPHNNFFDQPPPEIRIQGPLVVPQIHVTGDRRIVETTRTVDGTSWPDQPADQYDSEHDQGHQDRKRPNSDHGDLRTEYPLASKKRRTVEEFCVHLRNIPFKAKEIDVTQFLHPARIEGGPAMQFKTNGMNYGRAVVLLASKKDWEMAKSKNKQFLQGRSVNVFPTTYRVYLNMGGKDISGRLENDDQEETRSETDTCLFLENLPEYTEGRHLMDLFNKTSISPGGIHIFYFRSGSATGVAYIEFKTSYDRDGALRLHSPKIGSKFLKVSPVSKEEMCRKLDVRKTNGGIIGISMPKLRSQDNEMSNSSHYMNKADSRSYDRGEGIQSDNGYGNNGHQGQHHSRRGDHVEHQNHQEGREMNYSQNYDRDERSVGRMQDEPMGGRVNEAEFDDYNTEFGIELDYYEEGYPTDILPEDKQHSMYQQGPSGDLDRRQERSRTSRERVQSRERPSSRNNRETSRNTGETSRETRDRDRRASPRGGPSRDRLSSQRTAPKKSPARDSKAERKNSPKQPPKSSPTAGRAQSKGSSMPKRADTAKRPTDQEKRGADKKGTPQQKSLETSRKPNAESVEPVDDAMSMGTSEGVSVHIQNLNDDVQMEDLVDFVRAFDVHPETIELQCMEDSMKEEGMAKFSTRKDAERAVKILNGRRFRRRFVKVFV